MKYKLASDSGRKILSVMMLRMAVVAFACGLPLLSSSAFAVDALAVPTGGVVASGAAAIQSSAPGVLQVNQSSGRAVINWQSFNIGSAASTEFIQPAASSIAVNRIIGGGTDPTQILGTLKSNGRVVILDPNGVIFETGSVIDVGGLMASTGDFDLNAFNNGSQTVMLSSVDTGAVVNKGQITARDGGFVALVAPSVINSGIITARLGKVSLAAGKKATVDFAGDQMIQFTADGAFADTLVTNSGQVLADGGIIRMDAKTAKTVVDTVINTTGIVRANAVGVQNGKIILSAGVNGKASASGTIAASGDTTFSGTAASADSLIAGSGRIFFDNAYVYLTGRLYAPDGSLLDRSRMDGNASWAYIYNAASIQQGINVTGIGRIALIKAGTYSENIDLFKRITLWGEVTDGTTFPTLMGTVANGNVVTISGERAEMERINISANIAGSHLKSLYGASVDGINNVEIGKNIFSGFAEGGAGLYLNNASSAYVRHNVFEHNHLGVLAKNGGPLAKIFSNTFQQNQTGVEARNVTRFTVEGNTFSNTGTGMKLYDSQTVFVHSNGMESIALGAYASRVSGLKFRTNDLAGAGYEGFRVVDSDGVIVDRNWFGGATQAVHIERSNNALVKNNVLATPDDQIAKWNSTTVAGRGITLKNLSGAALSGNHIDDAFVSGIVLESASATTLSKNYIAHNMTGLSSSGDAAGYAQLTNNIFENNATGILFSKGGLDLQGVNTVLGGTTGLLMKGETVALTGLTLGNTVFNGQQKYHVALEEKAFFASGNKEPSVIDGTAATYDGIAAVTAMPKQVSAIEKKLLDFDDRKKLGQIFVGKEKGDHNGDGHPDNGQMKEAALPVMDQPLKTTPSISPPMLVSITVAAGGSEPSGEVSPSPIEDNGEDKED